MRRHLEVTLTEVFGSGVSDYDEIDTEDVPMRLGEHRLFELVTDTPQGRKKITITATVARWP